MKPMEKKSKLQSYLTKVGEKLSTYAFKLSRFDNIALVRIHGRGDLRAIGTTYGGWVVPVTLLGAESICFCLGCGEDISFDLGLIDQFNCDIFAFDPTPRAIKYVEKVAGQNPKYHFFEIGIWDKEETLKFYAPKNPQHVSHSLMNLQGTEDYLLVKVKRLKQLMNAIGCNEIDLLKIDIEGAEYKVIETIIEDKIDIKVICVEYDEYFNPLDHNFKERIRESVANLIAYGYSLVFSQYNGNYTFVKNV